MLHSSRYDQPSLPIPTMRVTAVRTSTIAMTDLILTSGTSVEGGKARGSGARLTFGRTICTHDRPSGASGLEEEAEGSSRAGSWPGLELGVAPKRSHAHHTPIERSIIAIL